jgi:hypothetical protein
MNLGMDGLRYGLSWSPRTLRMKFSKMSRCLGKWHSRQSAVYYPFPSQVSGHDSDSVFYQRNCDYDSTNLLFGLELPC